MKRVMRYVDMLVIVLAMAGLASHAPAQAFPSRPVHLLVGYPAGGAGDTLARAVGERLAQLWGQPVVVENRTGASGMIALEVLARAAPDGHTLGMFSAGHVIAGQRVSLPFRIESGFAPIALIAQQATILVVGTGVPARDVAQLVAYARENPERVTYGSGGPGSPAHVAAELFELQAAVSLVHIPYQGGVHALQGVVAGHVDMMFAPALPAMALIKSGKLRPLGVTTRSRNGLLTDLPTLSSAGIEYDLVDWHGLVGPAGMSPTLVDKIHGDVTRVMGREDINALLVAMAAEPMKATPAAFARLIADDAAKWSRLVKEGKISLH